MRPATLAEAIERIRDGDAAEKALAEFIDTFLSGADATTQKLEAFRTEPADHRRCTDSTRFVGAIAEYLAQAAPAVVEFRNGSLSPHRYLDDMRGTASSQLEARRCANISTFASPAEFRSRNIFTEERPLRRARAKTA